VCSYAFSTVSSSLCIKDVISARDIMQKFHDSALKLHEPKPDCLLMQNIYAFNIILYYLITVCEVKTLVHVDIKTDISQLIHSH
jgi:hypothetical protein